MGSVIPVDDHVPAGLAEGDLILLGDLIQHAAGGQRDGEVALIAAAALDHADEGIQLGVEGGGFILDGDGPGLLATQAERQGGHGIPLPDEDGALFALDGGGEGAIGDFAPAPIRQEGGVLGQRAALGLELTELIAAGKQLTISEACEYLSEVGLCARDYINREVDASLSGGELKRIEIATIIARGTELSVFDEPEAGIDLWSFNSLIKVFEKMQLENNNSILIISHQERILNIADKIIVLSFQLHKGGKLCLIRNDT